MRRPWLVGIGAVLAVLAAGAGGSWWWVARPGPLADTALVVIPRGGRAAMADALAAAGALRAPAALFPALVWVLARDRTLRAGEYRIAAGASMLDILREIEAGKVVVRHLTVPEGLTTAQVLGLIAASEHLDGPMPPPPPEGSLLPETYNYTHGDSRAGMMRRLHRAMDEALASAWAGRDPGLPLRSPAELLVLASMVEKETGIAAERAHVAGVFVNRLRLGMRLQSDPTVIYGVTNGQGALGRPLARGDLDRPTPFNTYANAGLPPGPIANPGQAALLAAAHPLPTDDLYFVADGSGGHSFAATIEAHNRNVAAWRRLQKQKETGTP